MIWYLKKNKQKLPLEPLEPVGLKGKGESLSFLSSHVWKGGVWSFCLFYFLGENVKMKWNERGFILGAAGPVSERETRKSFLSCFLPPSCWTRRSTKRRRDFLFLFLFSLFAIRESEKVNGGCDLYGWPLKGKMGWPWGFVLMDYTCHLPCDAIKRWGHMANFHWATNLSVMSKVSYM